MEPGWPEASRSPSKAQYGQYGPGRSQYSATTANVKKVTVCHKSKVTIWISVNAWKAHEAHGDVVGTCTQALAKLRPVKAAKAAKAAAAEEAEQAETVAKAKPKLAKAKVAKVKAKAKAEAAEAEQAAEAAQAAAAANAKKVEKATQGQEGQEGRREPAVGTDGERSVDRCRSRQRERNGQRQRPTATERQGERQALTWAWQAGIAGLPPPVAPYAVVSTGSCAPGGDDHPAVELPQAVGRVQRHGRLAGPDRKGAARLDELSARVSQSS